MGLMEVVKHAPCCPAISRLGRPGARLAHPIVLPRNFSRHSVPEYA